MLNTSTFCHLSINQKALDKVSYKRYNNAIEMTGGWK